MTAADVALINRWPTSEFNDFGPVPADWMLNTAIGRAVVIRNEDDAIIGRVSWHRVHYGPNPESAAWNIGIELLPEARGRGCGSEAQRLLAHYLFATTPLHRVEAVTDVDNAAELRALASAGFRREGVLRGAQFRALHLRDVVICSVLRGEV
ncbi:MAG TPA: GNAT family protein [Candidatus Dormibacteraeota bacterium]|nr:GNAT family protein [Candidatus Dormibacteraeota bacterium]